MSLTSDDKPDDDIQNKNNSIDTNTRNNTASVEDDDVDNVLT
jgi:hypothetical protein